MPKITVLPHIEICPSGKVIDNVPVGSSICKILLENHINIEHACEMSCACTTCHILVREGYNELLDMEEDEEDLLDRAWGLSPISRLACQIKMPNVDLILEIPKYSINHAKE
ncbi:2Fe-2S ferredoxin [Candidatus Kinetoplastibacterium sorsogonicusi]|uniref:2Fe-2S ferredoxin n=1 Tax=Candidatus Kinetoplastidibacterium kentomonadis TaxID=1576550 RepID=A0A3Q8ETK6_9PROT|nr:ISC system 2Fe-2S type ferredoxin [Candidatus Kinetoplastibacterium sorsogonicusi]AWD32365.1 2Fe-2S ferredoxin [Candidatus Kinetoplastibacterium sorsogonicusi]